MSAGRRKALRALALTTVGAGGVVAFVHYTQRAEWQVCLLKENTH